MECQQLINLIHQPAINRSQRIYDNIEYTYDDLVCEYEESLESDDIQNHFDEIEERKKTIEIQKEKKNHFYSKNHEIQNLPENKGKFIKSISVPLHNTLK